ncbi:MAG TPA: hypothetical protein VE990_07380 [Acidimicrobiales bacterium]|nr:hypothetical protein [Acidimicrobiales bacterium]
MTTLLERAIGDGIGRERALAGARRAGPLAAAGMAANAANVVVTVVLARLLTVRGYGSLNQLVSIYLVLSMPGSALLVAVVRRVTGWDARGRGAQVGDWAVRILRRGAGAVALVAAMAWLARHWIAGRMSLPNADGVPQVLVAGAAWALLCVERGLLQARRAYPALARNLAVEGAARTVLTLVLVVAGLGVGGATLGLLGGVAVALVEAARSVGRRPVETALPVPAGAGPRRHQRDLVPDVLTALGALALLAVLQSADVVLVGRLAPSRVGAYAAVSVASKALAFGALVLCGFLLPEAATRFGQGEHALHELGVALAVLSVPSATLVAMAVVAHRQVIAVFFGPQLAGSSSALVPLALAMSALGATMLFTHYLLGFGRRVVVAVLAAGAVVSVVVMAGAGGSPAATAWRDLCVQAAVAAAAGALVLGLPRPRTA